MQSLLLTAHYLLLAAYHLLPYFRCAPPLRSDGSRRDSSSPSDHTRATLCSLYRTFTGLQFLSICVKSRHLFYIINLKAVYFTCAASAFSAHVRPDTALRHILRFGFAIENSSGPRTREVIAGGRGAALPLLNRGFGASPLALRGVQPARA